MISGFRRFIQTQSESCADERLCALDVTVCPACGGGQRLVAVLTDPATICTYITGVGLAAEPSSIAAARPSPQRALELVV